MTKMTDEQIMALPTRGQASRKDKQLGATKSGAGAYASEAIGGSYSINWYSAFEDHKTGEKFKVYESDGVYGGRGAFDAEDKAEYEKQTRGVGDVLEMMGIPAAPEED